MRFNSFRFVVVGTTGFEPVALPTFSRDALSRTNEFE